MSNLRPAGMSISFPRLIQVPGLVWDSITYNPHTWDSFMDSWDWVDITDHAKQRLIASLFNAMVIDKNRLHGDIANMLELLQEDGFIERVSMQVPWTIAIETNVLYDFILDMVRAREEFLVHRRQGRTRPRMRSNVLACAVQRFMDLFEETPSPPYLFSKRTIVRTVDPSAHL